MPDEREQHPMIAAATAALRREDAEVARGAEAAIGWMVGDRGPEELTQDGLQTFLWYGLPMKWIMPEPGDHQRVALSLGRLLELLKMPRYAELCRSQTTAAVLDAYEGSDTEGKRAFRRAHDASGIEPPDLDELAWGSTMERHEAFARSSVADALELAIASGELVPGASGWRTRQQALAQVHLRAPQIELKGQSLLDAVLTERIDGWLGHRSRPARHAVLAPIIDQLRMPTPPPEGLDNPIPPLRWLLDALTDGQPLTQTGNLGRAFVQDAARRFEWWDLATPPRSETDLYELAQTRDLAQRARLARRSGRKLVRTRRGSATLDDPTLLWRDAARMLLPTNPFERAVGEITLALLVESVDVQRDTLLLALTEVVGEHGWRDQRTGDQPSQHDISWAYHATTNLLRALNLLVGNRWSIRSFELTPAGRAFALQALHTRATAPRTSPMDLI